MKLAVKRIGSHTLPLPAYAKPGDAGMDLRACLMDVDAVRFSRGIMDRDGLTLHNGGKAVIPCGFAFEIPEGHEMQARGRSGLSKDGILVHLGTIDWTYRGVVGIMVHNISGEDIIIVHGDRIAQAIVCPVARCEVIEATELSATDRGANGFGSTGAK